MKQWLEQPGTLFSLYSIGVICAWPCATHTDWDPENINAPNPTVGFSHLDRRKVQILKNLGFSEHLFCKMNNGNSLFSSVGCHENRCTTAVTCKPLILSPNAESEGHKSVCYPTTLLFYWCFWNVSFAGRIWQKWKRLWGPNLKILSLRFINTASKGLYKNNSDGTLFKALTSALLEELRPLAGCHKNT